MRRTTLALVLGLLAPTAVQAAPPLMPGPATATTSVSEPAPEPGSATLSERPGEQERLELEQQTQLDLSQPWQRYLAERRGENFYQFVEKDFRRKRDIGRGLTFGGLGSMVLGVALFSVGIPQPDQPIPLTTAGIVFMGAGGVSTIVGAVVWRIVFKKMEKLEVAEYRGVALGRRLRLRSFSPTGFSLAF